MWNILWLLILFLIKSTKQIIKNGVYNIILNNEYYLNYKNDKLQISFSKKFEEKSNFRINKLATNPFYIIEHVKTKLKLTLSSSNLKLSNDKDNESNWNFIKSDGKYYIKNRKKCYVRFKTQNLICDNISLKYATQFNLIKIYEEVNNNKYDLKLIEREPIDILIKYIDLSDPKLKRKGIPQIKKDKNNKELKYSVRSILKNIPWVRKIYILMPNKKVQFFKDYNLINDKIVYVNDKEFLGYDSSNSHAFQFRYWKLEYFNISKNFIVMDDDYFFGKPLKKSDFFYVENGKVVPSIIAKKFFEETMFSSKEKHNYYKLKAKKDKEQSASFYRYSLYTTYLFIMNLLKKNLTVPYFTHNAIPCNLKDLREIYYLVYRSKYKFSTLDSLKRHLESLQFQTFYMSYTFNKYNKKVHILSSKYIDIGRSITSDYNVSLFCINTGQKGYSNLSFKKARIVMENLFPEPTKYEIINYTELSSNAYDIISEMEIDVRNNKEIKRELERLKKQLKLLLFFLFLIIFKLLNISNLNNINIVSSL